MKGEGKGAGDVVTPPSTGTKVNHTPPPPVDETDVRVCPPAGRTFALPAGFAPFLGGILAAAWGPRGPGQQGFPPTRGHTRDRTSGVPLRGLSVSVAARGGTGPARPARKINHSSYIWTGEFRRRPLNAEHHTNFLQLLSLVLQNFTSNLQSSLQDRPQEIAYGGYLWL